MTSPKDDRNAAPVHFLRRRPVKLRRDVKGAAARRGPKTRCARERRHDRRGEEHRVPVFHLQPVWDAPAAWRSFRRRQSREFDHPVRLPWDGWPGWWTRRRHVLDASRGGQVECFRAVRPEHPGPRARRTP